MAREPAVYARYGLWLAPLSPAEFAAFIRTEALKSEKMIRDSGIESES